MVNISKGWAINLGIVCINYTIKMCNSIIYTWKKITFVYQFVLQ